MLACLLRLKCHPQNYDFKEIFPIGGTRKSQRRVIGTEMNALKYGELLL